MQVNGTSVMERTASSPVISGLWFESAGKPFVLRMEHPLGFGEMVAALYREAGFIFAGDLATDEDVCGQLAVTLTTDGLTAIQDRAETIERDEARGRIEHPEWLAFCRQRVTALLSGGEQR